MAAFLAAQLEEAETIARERMTIWQRYHELLAPLETRCVLRRPIVPDGCCHNAHMYYVLLAPEIKRHRILEEINQQDISSVFHYVPLHSSPAGRRYGRTHGTLEVTNRESERLIRRPLFVGLTVPQQERVVHALEAALDRNR